VSVGDRRCVREQCTRGLVGPRALESYTVATAKKQANRDQTMVEAAGDRAGLERTRKRMGNEGDTFASSGTQHAGSSSKID
jgi:hypothetical protein